MHNCIRCGKVSHTRNTMGKYCSNRCQEVEQWEQKKLIIEANSHMGTSTNQKRPLKRYLKEKDNSCSSCGISRWEGKELNLEIDHINGIRSENYLSNVRLLCPNCHSQTPNFKGKNKGTYLAMNDKQFHPFGIGKNSPIPR